MLRIFQVMFWVLVWGRLPPKKCGFTYCLNSNGRENKAADYCKLGFCTEHCSRNCGCLNPLVVAAKEENKLLLEADKD